MVEAMVCQESPHMKLSEGSSSLPASRNPLEERKATWMELFDLAFVVAIASVAHQLSGAELPAGLLQYSILLSLLLWAWAAYTFFNDRFDEDNLVQRLLAVAQMALVLMIAALHDWLGHDYALFVGCYSALRGINIVSNLVAGAQIPEACRLTRGVALVVFVALIPLFIGLFFENSEVRLALAGVSALLQMALPVLATRENEKLPLSVSHIPERIGLFITLALGECLVSITNVGAIASSYASLIPGSLALLVVFFSGPNILPNKVVLCCNVRPLVPWCGFTCIYR